MYFLKSIFWQEFQQKYGRKVSRVGDANIIYYPLKFGLTWGLVSSMDEKDLAQIDEIIKDARENKAIYLKLEPSAKFSWTKFKNFKFRISKNVHPEQTLVLDLSKSESELMASMKQKTRYNIRLAEKKGVEVEKNPDRCVEEFYNMVKETEIRDRAKFHSLKYYADMFEILNQKYHRLDIYLAKINKVYIAGAILYHDFENKTSYYLHGASKSEYKNTMAPYLLQWQMIKDCQKLGQKRYDFFGIKTKNPDDLIADENHRWFGITKFKLGFAPEGKLKNYPKAKDLILRSIWYKIYSAWQKIR